MWNKSLFVLTAVFGCALASPIGLTHDKTRQQFIDEINSTPNITWFAAAHPRFEGTPLGSSASLCGVKPGAKAALDLAIRQGTVRMTESVKSSNIELPDSFDSATNPAWSKCAKVISDIRDQSNCGCCWAFGAASAASDRMCIATNGSVALPISAEDVCFCGSSDGCGGGMLPDAWQYIQQTGAVTGGQQGDGPFDADGLCADFTLPHCHHHGPQGKDPYPAEGKKGCPSESSPKCPAKCGANAKAPHNHFSKDKYKFDGDVISYPDAESIAAGIMAHGPVEAAFDVYSDFENYAGGIYKHTTGSQLGGHAIRIVGWGVEKGTKYWKVANSWNKYWGEDGYFRIVRGSNNCGIEDQVTSSSADATWSGGSLPPAPPAPTGCLGAMRKACGDAKSAGPAICTGCCAENDKKLEAAGCSHSDEEKWCASGY